MYFQNDTFLIKLKFAIFSGHSTNTNIYASIFPNIRQFTNEKEEGYIEELTRTSVSKYKNSSFIYPSGGIASSLEDG